MISRVAKWPSQFVNLSSVSFFVNRRAGPRNSHGRFPIWMISPTALATFRKLENGEQSGKDRMTVTACRVACACGRAGGTPRTDVAAIFVVVVVF